MGTEAETTSSWFVLNGGFKVYGRCPRCASPRISYYKERVSGLRGISAQSKGLVPVCIDCEQALPTRARSPARQRGPRPEKRNKTL
jgi:hypothetical protein